MYVKVIKSQVNIKKHEVLAFNWYFPKSTRNFICSEFKIFVLPHTKKKKKKKIPQISPVHTCLHIRISRPELAFYLEEYIFLISRSWQGIYLLTLYIQTSHGSTYILYHWNHFDKDLTTLKPLLLNITHHIVQAQYQVDVRKSSRLFSW